MIRFVTLFTVLLINVKQFDCLLFFIIKKQIKISKKLYKKRQFIIETDRKKSWLKMIFLHVPDIFQRIEKKKLQ